MVWMTRLGIMAMLTGSMPLLAAGAAEWQDAALQSSLPQLAIAALAELPAAPEAPAGQQRDYCRHLAIAPATQAGRQVERAGWAVTGELTHDGLTMVSFVAGMEQGTSGSCLLRDGNIGFFSGAALLAIAYSPEPGAFSIGHIERPGESTIRIWDGDFLPRPIGDIRIGPGHAVDLVPLPVSDAYCGGGAIVPFIYDVPIAQARLLLAAHGWEPALAAEAEPLDSRSAALAADGLPEVTSCSGTGFGFCNFEYRSPAAQLSVMTVGEGTPADTPAVADYAIACRAANQG